MPGPKEILVTTTSILQNLEIKRYIKPISAQIVAGAGVFSDFAASFTDVFGGRSSTYQNRLTSLYNEAIAKLKAEAFEIGANGIVGLKIDMNEISGKGKEMFMISAIGTAVVINGYNVQRENIISAEKIENVSLEKIKLLQRKRQIIADANSGRLALNDDIWDFVISNQVDELFEFILIQLRNSLTIDEAFSKVYKNTVDFLNALPEEKRLNLLYGSIIKEDNEQLSVKLCEMVAGLRLLDFNYIEILMEVQEFSKRKRALRVLKYNKPFFNREDVEKFSSLINVIREKFPERGVRSMKKQLLSSKEKEIWTCECGKTSDIGSNCPSCQKDIHGFSSNDVTSEEAISKIEERIGLILSFIEPSSI